MDSAQTETASAPVKEETGNFLLALMAGLVAALVGAGLWAAVTVATESELGLMAIAVGFIVGYAIKVAGRGDDAKFSVLGAICALLGCMLGNLLSSMIFYANAKGLDVTQVAMSATPDFLIQLSTAFFTPMDLLFYAIAIYEGYKFSTR